MLLLDGLPVLHVATLLFGGLPATVSSQGINFIVLCTAWAKLSNWNTLEFDSVAVLYSSAVHHVAVQEWAKVAA